MEPGHFAALSWIPNKEIMTFPSSHTDTITIYDAGDIQGFLLKEATGKTRWIVFQVAYRLQQDNGIIVEGCDILHESYAPLHYFSIETYPVKFQQEGELQFLFSLPQTQILLTLSETPLLPLLPLLQQQTQPFPVQHQSHDVPVSREPPKLNSKMPTHGQQLSQNKNISSPKLKVSPSSNQGDHGRHLSQAPKKRGVHQQPYSPIHQTGHESSESPQWSSLAQQSLYSRPPPEVGVKYAGRVSTSPCLIDS